MTQQLPARRYLEQNGCASFKHEAKVHFLLWESVDAQHEEMLKREGWFLTGTSILIKRGGKVWGWTPTICSQNRRVKGKERHGEVTIHRQPLVTSEPSQVTCVVCLTKLVMLGISCGCVDA